MRTHGNWDPEVRGMFFAAGANLAISYEEEIKLKQSNLFAVNDLAAQGSTKIDRTSTIFRMFEASIEAGVPTFLDSGIFWLTNEHKRAHGTTMDQALALAPEDIDGFDWLIEVYVKICREYGDRLWGYNELDQGGALNKRRIRAILETEHGLGPIPVYHPLNDGWDYFDELAENYDRICVGNLVQAGPAVRKRLLYTIFERHRKYPDLFIHYLGLTPNQFQYALPFDSADSSSWMAAMRFGTMRFGSMGKATHELAAEFRLPLSIDVGKEEHNKRYTRMIRISLANQAATERCMRHWHAELADAFNLERYPAL